MGARGQKVRGGDTGREQQTGQVRTGGGGAADGTGQAAGLSYAQWMMSKEALDRSCVACPE